MQYEVEVNGRLRQVHVHRADGCFAVSLEAGEWTVDAARVDAHTWSLLIPEVRLPPSPPSGFGEPSKPDTTTGGEARRKPDGTTGGEADVVSAFRRTVAVSHEVHISPEPVSGRLEVRVGSVLLAVSLNGRRRWGRKDEGGLLGSAPQRMTAPMPGKVVRVLVKPGDPVRVRQPVVVIEAMKMENELRAGRDGTVAEVQVRAGQSVEAGALLAVIA